MKKVPISIIIDDPTPVISVFYVHEPARVTKDGRDVEKYIPNSMLFEFCDIVERYGIKGKFSLVPSPGNMGDIVNGIEGVDDVEMHEWLDTVKKRITPYFGIGPEMLTHHMAVDLATGKDLPERESVWSQTQDRNTLAPYIAKALSLLKEAGFDSCGVTSPWNFGFHVEDEYAAAISKAVQDVYGKKNSWYFLRGLRGVPDARPWVAYEEDGRTVVSVPATTKDLFWQTIDCPDTSDEYVSRVADEMITADGKNGEIIRILDTNGYPILGSHWQSFASNGLNTGLRVLETVAERVEKHLSDRVEWMTVEEIMEMVIENKEAYPKR